MQTKIEFHKGEDRRIVCRDQTVCRCWFWIPSVAAFSHKLTHLIFKDTHKKKF